MAPPLSLLLLLLTTSLSITISTPHLLLPLTHTLSHRNTTTLHLLKSTTTQSTSRHHRRQISLPLSPGTDYTLSLSLGPHPISLYLDTGSDLVWLPCSPFECILCESKPTPKTPPFPPPPSSSPLPCTSPFCSAAHSNLPSSDLCAIAGCNLADIETSSCKPTTSPCPNFYYAYGDGSLVAHLRTGPLSLAQIQIKDFTFACAHTALAEPVGVAGFGGGLLSLPAQLATRRFSYCLVSHAFDPSRLIRPSPLILGRSPDPVQFTYTPILSNPKYPYFYTVGLDSISVGPARLPAGNRMVSVDRDGNGGMVVDSGTTYTMLPSGLHARVAGEFDRVMRTSGFDRAGEVESETGLGPCYGYLGRGDARRVPGLAFHFAGNASVWLPRRNYFLGFEHGGKRVGCLMLMDGGDESGGPAATLGNYQQQGFEVVYDLEVNRVGFARRPCAALWDSLSRG